MCKLIVVALVLFIGHFSNANTLVCLPQDPHIRQWLVEIKLDAGNAISAKVSYPGAEPTEVPVKNEVENQTEVYRGQNFEMVFDLVDTVPRYNPFPGYLGWNATAVRLPGCEGLLAPYDLKMACKLVRD